LDSLRGILYIKNPEEQDLQRTQRFQVPGCFLRIVQRGRRGESANSSLECLNEESEFDKGPQGANQHAKKCFWAKLDMSLM
jgi:hypothetical protein